MSNYEFWDELGKIFNAVVAYQEKSIEFNKRFINPWIRLGNVFEKQDRHKEAIEAYKKAIELDPGNAENWYELGNAYFQSEAYDQAADAFNRAIELNPQFGWAYSNLALALTTQGKHAEAIPLFQIGVDLVEGDKDKAVIWNRLGNAYRKLNEYGLAVQAFQKADELDSENAGFRDELDEAEEGPSLVEGNTEAGTNQPADLNLSPIQLIVEESHAEEAASAQTEAVEAPAPLPEVTEVAAEATAVAESTPSEAVAQTEPEAAQATDQPATEIAVAENAEQNIEAVAEAAHEATEQPVEAVSEVTETAAEQTAAQSASEEAVTVPITARKETVTVAVQTTVETFTDSLSVTNTSTETSEALAAADVIAESAPQTQENPATEPEAKAEVVESSASAVTEETSVEDTVSEETVEAEASQPEPAPGEAEEVQTEPQTSVSEVKVIHIEEETIVISEAVEEKIVEATDQTNDDPSVTDHAAYEEYLKDNAAVLNAAVSVDEQADEHNAMLPPEPAAKIDPSGEFRIEVDAKNAHVWNELGNVYFNTGEIDDAVVAYSKAIELDRWFAWPYSNLALAYVQKGRFVEAILLYQRSIELFASEKDKAISWNRLGNVYRRLNDYDNAIAAYQRADELDPDNTTLSLQSRFSLLGSYAMEPKPSYAS